MIISGFRPDEPLKYDTTDDGEIISRYHPGTCFQCDKPITWKQWLEVWTEDDNGQLWPDWDSSTAWSYTCPYCGSMASDPYSDGLIRLWNNEDISLED